jgi:hypothetical protein
MYFVGRHLSSEQFQTGTNDLLYGIYDWRQNLIRHNFIWLTDQAAFQGPAPSDPQFGIDVDDVDSSSNCMYEILIIRSRPVE